MPKPPKISDPLYDRMHYWIDALKGEGYWQWDAFDASFNSPGSFDPMLKWYSDLFEKPTKKKKPKNKNSQTNKPKGNEK